MSLSTDLKEAMCNDFAKHLSMEAINSLST